MKNKRKEKYEIEIIGGICEEIIKLQEEVKQLKINKGA